ncbi:hypothetical protein BKA93DRAFT_442434 [Sparassis latifolia]
MPDQRHSILLLSLNKFSGFDELHGHLLTALRAKAEVHEVTSSGNAIQRLSTAPHPKAIIVTDAGVTERKNNKVLAKLVEYVTSGGTIIFACQFSSFVRPVDMNSMFQKSWNLPWNAGSYHRTTFALNSSVKGLGLDGLASEYSMKAVHLRNVALHASVYLPTSESCIQSLVFAPSPVGRLNETPVAFASFGNGYIGYVGDVNAEENSSNVVIAMCLASEPRLASGTPTPPNNVQAVRENMKPIILMLSLEKEPWIDDSYSQLYSGLSKNATLHEARTVREANRILNTSPSPFAVLATDSGIARRKHLNLLMRLVEYTRAGGRIVIGCQFSNNLPLDCAERFFARWNLPWDAGSYCRTTFALNPAGIPSPLSRRALFPQYSMKALHLKNVSPETAVYIPTSQSQVESHVFPATPITGAQLEESPATFAHVGEGYLGYVGDVNGEQQTIRLLIEMCGVRIKPGDLGTRNCMTGVSFGPNGMETQRQYFSETPLPVYPEIIVRPRDTEVTARAVRRTSHAREQQALAEKLKQEGNDFYKDGAWEDAAEAYRKAAFVYGPWPVYMTNLAAALLKLRLWDEAESATDRALRYEPKNLKARFRRGIARKELGDYAAAIKDFYSVLRQDPNNGAARTELAATLSLQSAESGYSIAAVVDESRPENEDACSDILTESDSSDFAIVGDSDMGVCKSHNHQGCAEGRQCRYRHAPDNFSVRDMLGRNVCLMWLLGTCRYDQGCSYNHDDTYLPTRGWWADEWKLARMRDDVQNLLRQGLQLEEVENMIPSRWPTWRQDAWAVAENYRE